MKDAMQTKECCHCGASVPFDQIICMKCGCRASREVNVVIKRKKAFVGFAVPLVIDIRNEMAKACISVSNGGSASVHLPIGIYNFDITLGLTESKQSVSITKDTVLECSIKPGFSKHSLVVTEIN